MINVCKECESEFNTNHPIHKGGFINVCGSCKPETTNRYMGFIASTGKSDYFTEIIDVHDEDLAKFIIRQSKSGPSQCGKSLALSNNGSALTSTKERHNGK